MKKSFFAHFCLFLLIFVYFGITGCNRSSDISPISPATENNFSKNQQIISSDNSDIFWNELKTKLDNKSNVKEIIDFIKLNGNSFKSTGPLLSKEEFNKIISQFKNLKNSNVKNILKSDDIWAVNYMYGEITEDQKIIFNPVATEYTSVIQELGFVGTLDGNVDVQFKENTDFLGQMNGTGYDTSHTYLNVSHYWHWALDTAAHIRESMYTDCQFTY